MAIKRGGRRDLSLRYARSQISLLGEKTLPESGTAKRTVSYSVLWPFQAETKLTENQNPDDFARNAQFGPKKSL